MWPGAIFSENGNKSEFAFYWWSLRRTECDAEFFPRRSRAGCGRDGAAASRFCRNLSQLGTSLSGTVFGFSIVGGDALPERLSSLLGVLHLFTPLGISVVILCNTTTFLFPGVVLSRNSDFYYVFFFFTIMGRTAATELMPDFIGRTLSHGRLWLLENLGSGAYGKVLEKSTVLRILPSLLRSRDTMLSSVSISQNQIHTPTFSSSANLLYTNWCLVIQILSPSTISSMKIALSTSFWIFVLGRLIFRHHWKAPLS